MRACLVAALILLTPVSTATAQQLPEVQQFQEYQLGAGQTLLGEDAIGQDIYVYRPDSVWSGRIVDNNMMTPRETPDVGPITIQPYGGPGPIQPALPRWFQPASPSSTTPAPLFLWNWIMDPVVGPNNVGIYNDHTEALNVDLLIGTERRPITLLAREILTVEYQMGQNMSAIVGTGDQDFKLQLGPGKLYRLHPSDGKYVISLLSGTQQ
ncbi:MAG: hypothetical protein ACK4P4_01245 [Allorhizobium sp.]